MMETSQKISFRRLDEEDLALMQGWLTQPHVKEWYGKENDYSRLDKVRERYLPYIRGVKPTLPYLICYNKTPIGYIQTYMVKDYPDYCKHLKVEQGAAGLDLFIGEPAYLYKGLGPQIIRRFLQEETFQHLPATCCVIGPDHNNHKAIKAYEKAGFEFLKKVLIPEETAPEYLMILKK